MWTLAVAVALAATPHVDDAGEFAMLADRPWLVDAINVALPGVDLHLGDGYAFAVELDGAPAGLVWVGDGEAVVHPSAAEGEVIANRMVVLGHAPRSAMAPVARGEAWALPLDRVVLLTADPEVRDALEAQTPVSRGRDRMVTDADGVPIVTVTDTPGLAAARAQARADLEMRVHRASELGRDPRVLLEVAHTAEPAWVAAHGPTSLGPLLEPYHGESADDVTWLHAWRDEGGVFSREHTGAVAVMGWDRAQRPARRDVVRVGPPPADGLVVDARVVQALGRVDGTDKRIVVDVEASVVVRAVGDAPSVLLRVPRVRQSAWGGQEKPLPSTWTLDAVRDEDGRDLAWRFADPHDAHDDGTDVMVEVFPDPPLADGDVATVRLRWEDGARLRHFVISERGTDLGTHEEVYPLGTATQLLDLAPQVVRAAGPSAPTLLQAGVPATAKLQVISGGVPADAPVRDGLVAAAAVVPGDHTAVSFGKWRVVEEPAAAGMPAVRVATLPESGTVTGMASDVRQVLAFFAPALPEPVSPALTVIELPALPGALLWYGPRAGVLPLPTATALTGGGFGPQSIIPEARMRRDLPHLEGAVIAAAAAAQPWLDVDDGPASAWARHAFARAYAELWVREVFGDDDAAAWKDAWFRGTRAWMPQGRAPLPPDDVTVGGPVPWVAAISAGAVVTGHTLRDLVGEDAWLRAVDALLRGEHGDVGSIDALADALSAAAGRDVGPVVRFWLQTALPPRLDADVDVIGEDAVVTVTCDVPFGTLEVPVQLADGVVVRVTVVDGAGEARAPAPDAPLDVVIDPDRTLLTWP